MPTLHLTKSVIDELRPLSVDVVYWDESLAGFGVKVTPKGRKVFIVLYRTKDGFSRLRKYTIGPYGQVTLAIARITAQKVLAARLDGQDPAGDKRRKRQKVIQDGLEDVLAEYRLRHVNSTRSAKETNRIFDREVCNRWKGYSIHQITRQDVLSLVDEIADRGSPAMASKVFKTIGALFNWAIGRGLIDKSPCTGMSKPSEGQPRDRILSDDELKAVIFAARQTRRPYGAIVELLALTGQRRSEVSDLAWVELDLGKRIWTIPSVRSKTGRPPMVHLTQRAVELIQIEEASCELVFPSITGKRFNGFSNAKRELDETSGVSNWVLHDLRRTAVSGMARLGVAPHVADKILNHQSGTISGVAAVYQRHDFLAERKAATKLWGDHVGHLLQPQVASAIK